MPENKATGCPYHPEQGHTCRGCPASLDPFVFDGGCGQQLPPEALQRAQADARARHEARRTWKRSIRRKG